MGNSQRSWRAFNPRTWRAWAKWVGLVLRFFYDAVRPLRPWPYAFLAGLGVGDGRSVLTRPWECQGGCD